MVAIIATIIISFIAPSHLIRNIFRRAYLESDGHCAHLRYFALSQPHFIILILKSEILGIFAFNISR